jgi:hypothetical protein
MGQTFWFPLHDIGHCECVWLEWHLWVECQWQIWYWCCIWVHLMIGQRFSARVMSKCRKRMTLLSSESGQFLRPQNVTASSGRTLMRSTTVPAFRPCIVINADQVYWCFGEPAVVSASASILYIPLETGPMLGILASTTVLSEKLQQQCLDYPDKAMQSPCLATPTLQWPNDPNDKLNWWAYPCSSTWTEQLHCMSPHGKHYFSGGF